MTKKTTVESGSISLASAKNPMVATKKRREKEAAELEARRQLEIAHKAKNIVSPKVKQTMAQKMEAAALGRQTEHEAEQGELHTIPSPSGSIYCRIEPELLAEVIELSWGINFHEKKWADERELNEVEDGDKWTPGMAENWELMQESTKKRKLLAPAKKALSKAFWGTMLGALVGEQPMHVDGFEVYNKLPYETKQLFLETWAEMIEADIHEKETAANEGVDDSGLQEGGMTDRGCYIGDGKKMTNATAATGIGRSA